MEFNHLQNKKNIPTIEAGYKRVLVVFITYFDEQEPPLPCKIYHQFTEQQLQDIVLTDFVFFSILDPTELKS